MKQRWNTVDAILTPTERFILRAFATNNICLEIGAYKGGSTVCMAETAKQVHSVDTFKADLGNSDVQRNDYTTLPHFLENIKGYTNVIHHIGFSQDILPKLDIIFDFIFVDGNHEFHNVVNDINLCWPKLKQGGLIMFHDYFGKNPPGVKMAIEQVLPEYANKVIKVSDLAVAFLKGE